MRHVWIVQEMIPALSPFALRKVRNVRGAKGDFDRGTVLAEADVDELLGVWDLFRSPAYAADSAPAGG